MAPRMGFHSEHEFGSSIVSYTNPGGRVFQLLATSLRRAFTQTGPTTTIRDLGPESHSRRFSERVGAFGERDVRLPGGLMFGENALPNKIRLWSSRGARSKVEGRHGWGASLPPSQSYGETGRARR